MNREDIHREVTHAKDILLTLPESEVMESMIGADAAGYVCIAYDSLIEALRIIEEDNA